MIRLNFLQEKGIVDLTGGFYFQFPTQKLVEYHRKHAPVFFYHYDYKGGLTLYSAIKAYKEEGKHNVNLGGAGAELVVNKAGRTLQNELSVQNNLAHKWSKQKVLHYLFPTEFCIVSSILQVQS